jgi:hypothetical protein
MAITDDALFGYKSLEDVWAQEIPSGHDELVLGFKDSALERPIRKCRKAGGVTDDPMTTSSFTAIFKSTLTNAGYLVAHRFTRCGGNSAGALIASVSISYLGGRAVWISYKVEAISGQWVRYSFDDL